MERENKETSREDFIQLVKEKGKVIAALSHTQAKPDRIHNAAILEWQYDTELFCITANGKRLVANKDMPAFHVYK